MGVIFSPRDRDRVRAYLLELARSDGRILSGAAVGSWAVGHEDRWSDIDLTFGLRKGADPKVILREWTAALSENFGSVHLFDVTSRSTVYRVLLFPKNLQVDISLTPGFVAEYGPRFRLLFGTSYRSLPDTPQSADEVFGYAAHHVVRARFSISRNRLWQAEYWISSALHESLSLGCLNRKLDVSHGRGFDRLPLALRKAATRCLVRRTESNELLRALVCTLDLLLVEAQGRVDNAGLLEEQLRGLVTARFDRMPPRVRRSRPL
jgi:hypothetical protein